ncbi:unnamed protein product [Linum trigynum]|uniref:Uncharacterized protein n=1 Tax=Linum trigynum TaxID=586398 RepID=A0AAV2FB02_9ROSI
MLDVLFLLDFLYLDRDMHNEGLARDGSDYSASRVTSWIKDVRKPFKATMHSSRVTVPHHAIIMSLRTRVLVVSSLKKATYSIQLAIQLEGLKELATRESTLASPPTWPVFSLRPPAWRPTESLLAAWRRWFGVWSYKKNDQKGGR